MIPRILSDRLRRPASRVFAASPGLGRLSIHQTTTQRWSLPQAVAGYERAGVAGIGVHLSKVEQHGREESIELLRRTPLRVTSLGWAGGFTGDHDHTFRDAVDEAVEIVKLASAIRAEEVRVVPGTAGGHIQSHARRLLADGLRELVPVAREERVRLALQPMHRLYEREWSFVCDIDATMEVLSQFSPAQVGLAFGTYHYWDQDRLLDRLRELVPWICSVQLSDWRAAPRCDNDRALPGDGIAPLAEMVRELESRGFGGWYEIEVWSRDLWKEEPDGLIRRAVDSFCGLPVAAFA